MDEILCKMLVNIDNHHRDRISLGGVCTIIYKQITLKHINDFISIFFIGDKLYLGYRLSN